MSKAANRAAEAHEVILDQEDGLDWPTLCKCDLLRTVPKTQLTSRRGHVTDARRRQIIETINRCNDWI
jgi:mRNA-degrading endonuclease toxin of MazEF toxin-antitoxin module